MSCYKLRFIQGVITSQNLDSMPGRRKYADVRQVIMSPLLLALATFIHNKYGSTELIDVLCNHESFNEVVKVVNVQMKEFFSHAGLCGGLVQFVFDNVDVNIATATGHGTFHAKGGNSVDDASFPS